MWPDVKKELLQCVKQFFKGKSILQATNYTFITLIPKTPTANDMGDFRLISCVNLIYKLLTKILANMLAKVTGEISPPTKKPSLKME